MKLSELLKNTDKTHISFEILPLKKGDNIQTIYDTLDPLFEFKPSFINITYHRQEVIYKKHHSGLLEKKTVRKRPGTVSIAAALKYKYGVEVVPHLICGGFNREETENALIDLHFLDIDNVLVIRGDADRNSRMFTPEADGHKYALDLVKQIIDLNNGKYLDEEIENSTPTHFCIGVAGYPEKHCESPNKNFDFEVLKQKIDAGAGYIVTQLFFDNKYFFDFEKKCRENGINVPIVPGLKPIANFNHINLIPRFFNVEIPEELEKEVRKCKTNSEVHQVGIEWTIAQSKELLAHKVPCIHYYTMGKAENVIEVCKKVF